MERLKSVAGVAAAWWGGGRGGRHTLHHWLNILKTQRSANDKDSKSKEIKRHEKGPEGQIAGNKTAKGCRRRGRGGRRRRARTRSRSSPTPFKRITVHVLASIPLERATVVAAPMAGW